ncbi:MAG TPA: SWIM zinc finger family protein [Mycobacterium sp.]|nr:SWIM zinc finger family protein [Mycobacterium sp.]
MTTTVTTTCEKCRGIGEVPSGYATLYGGCAWRVCPVCDGRGVVEVEPEPTPPAPAGRLNADGYSVDAPTFRSAAQFDAAVGRAFADGLTVSATSRADVVIVRNHATGATYRTSRTTCECEAGQHGLPCKHQAALVMYADVFHEAPASRAA